MPCRISFLISFFNKEETDLNVFASFTEREPTSDLYEFKTVAREHYLSMTIYAKKDKDDTSNTP